MTSRPGAPMGHAIVGCGRVAPCHADAFGRLEDVRLAWAVDPDLDHARELASRFSIEQATAVYEDALADDTLASVSLCTPHDLHARMTLTALEAGKHVLVEKPFVIDPADGERVAAAARRAGRVVMPVTQHRFDVPLVHIRKIVTSGELGPLSMVRAHLECVRPPEYYRDSPWRGRWAREGGSVLINQAYHVVDLLLWLAGPVTSVAASFHRHADPSIMETEDALAATLRFQGGALGTLGVNGAGGAAWGSFVELCGRDGVIAFDIGYPNVVSRLSLRSRRATRDYRQLFATLANDAAPAPPGLAYYGISHRDQARVFVDSVLGRDPAPSSGADLEQALSTVRLIEAMYRSGREGSIVRLIPEAR
ncbi:MAG: Gfo/Idh/MocA family oxidoreductase [Candidatus Riflebacteria bacterium]|nr:Gfo/Idh/MocA family oxidoreductase [Candidatus Riflebacteria bacterium]